MREYLVEAQRRQVDYIVALRGDPPQGQAEFRPVPGGLRHANELVALIRAEFPQFGIAVAGYPETHREAPGWEADLQNLQRKIAAGADLVITQLFYDNADYFRFRERCDSQGLRVPIVPGILPVTSLAQIQRITSMCGAHLPADLVAELQRREAPEWQFQVGVEFARRQVEGLLAGGVPGLHFYVLNKSQAASQVLQNVGFPENSPAVSCLTVSCWLGRPQRPSPWAAACRPGPPRRPSHACSGARHAGSCRGRQTGCRGVPAEAGLGAGGV